MACLVNAYHEEEVKGDTRVVVRFHPRMAPIKAAILPLVKRDGMPEIAHDHRRFALTLPRRIRRGGAVGRRYRRMDEVGTPFVSPSIQKRWKMIP